MQSISDLTQSSLPPLVAVTLAAACTDGPDKKMATERHQIQEAQHFAILTPFILKRTMASDTIICLLLDTTL